MKRFALTAKWSAFLLAICMLLHSVTAFSEHSPWDCPTPGCSRTGNKGNYCGSCGQPAPWLWDCPVCGRKGNSENFCSDCGSKAPEKWDCPECGKKGITGNFCPNCGHKGRSSEGTAGAAGKSTVPAVNVGDYVTFGHYEQDNDKSNGQEQIEWLVLAKEGSKVLLISRYGLNAHCYHKETPYPTWAKSDIRNWLNSTFLNEAFTPAEQAGIVTTTVSTPSYYGNSGGADTQDKIWLLSREEAEKYYRHDASRKAVPTVYAVARGAWQYDGNNIASKLNGEGCCWWWLRSPGFANNYASSISHGGSLYSRNVNYASDAVRPALWLDLDLAVF